MKVMTVIGTRPEAIKMAPILRQLASDSKLESILVNTGQHKEMIDQVLDLFSLTPNYDLALMKRNQQVATLSSEIIVGIFQIIKQEQPSLVFVHGDTTTAFAAAYVAFLNQIRVAHVEAGLRTYDIYSPFPEEINRQLISRLSHYHFACTKENQQNLLKENISPDRILITGNTVIDAIQEISNKPYHPTPNLEALFQIKGRIILVTTHRRENLHVLKRVYEALNQVVTKNPDIHVIIPVHKNPLVQKQVRDFLNKNERVHVLEPLDYLSFCHLMKRSYLILTDSGGIQEEACALNIPCLVTRETTERPEAIQTSAIRLVGTDPNRIFQEIQLLLTDSTEYQKMVHAKNPFGDGKSAKRIIRFIKQIGANSSDQQE